MHSADDIIVEGYAPLKETSVHHISVDVIVPDLIVTRVVPKGVFVPCCTALAGFMISAMIATGHFSLPEFYFLSPVDSTISTYINYANNDVTPPDGTQLVDDEVGAWNKFDNFVESWYDDHDIQYDASMETGDEHGEDAMAVQDFFYYNEDDNNTWQNEYDDYELDNDDDAWMDPEDAWLVIEETITITITWVQKIWYSVWCEDDEDAWPVWLFDGKSINNDVSMKSSDDFSPGIEEPQAIPTFLDDYEPLYLPRAG